MATLIQIVRERIGSRRIVSREEMADLLLAMHRQAGLNLANGYCPATLGDQPAAAHDWARRVSGLTVVSASMRDHVGEPKRYLRDGDIRYDQPGSMHPLQHAEVVFVAADLGRYEYDQIGQMRRHADRLLIVRGE